MTTTRASTTSSDTEPAPQQVAEYLRNNPDFFEQRAELLEDLRLPHASGRAVSLVERQIQLLREQNSELKARLLDLVDVARDNDRLNERMHRLTLELLKTDGLPALLDTLNDHLRREFRADAVALHLSGRDEAQVREAGARLLPDDEATRTLFESLFATGRPLCGRLKKAQLEHLFGDQAAALESAAVVPLGDKAERGLLAIGSCESIRFHPGMGTLFLSNLGELLGQLLASR